MVGESFRGGFVMVWETPSTLETGKIFITAEYTAWHGMVSTRSMPCKTRDFHVF